MTGEKPQRPEWLTVGAEVFLWRANGPVTGRYALRRGHVSKVQRSRFTATLITAPGVYHAWDFVLVALADGAHDMHATHRIGDSRWRCAPPDAVAVLDAREIGAMLDALRHVNLAADSALHSFGEIGATIHTMRAAFTDAANATFEAFAPPPNRAQLAAAAAEEAHDG